MTNSTENPKINVFYQLLILLGIIPPHYIVMGNNNNCIIRRFYKLYIVFLAFVITLTAIVVLIYHFRLLQSEFPNSTLLFTDAAQDITGTICSIVAILAPTFVYSSTLDALLENCRHMPRTSFLEEMLKITSSKRFKMQIIIFHIIILILFAFDGYVWISSFGIGQYSSFIFRKLQIYHNFMTILAIYAFVKFIKTQLEVTNSYLTEKLESRGIKGRKKNVFIEVSTEFDNVQICSEIRHITQFYENHVEQVRLFNKLFGCQLLFLTIFVRGIHLFYKYNNFFLPFQLCNGISSLSHSDAPALLDTLAIGK